MKLGKTMAIALAALVGIMALSEEKQPSVEANDAVLDTIAQINHINWVVNVIKSYNNVIVLEEEYEKISPGNLYLDRIPDEETLGRITKMLDTLYSLRKDDRQMKKWRMDFRESRDRKIRDHKHKATKEAVDTITGQVKECCSLWEWATNPLGSIANVAGTAFNMAHYSVGLHNDYDNFVYELDKTAKDKQFDFDGEKLDLLHNQNKEILQDQWQFIRRYKLDDRLRVSDVDIKMLLNCLKNDNPAWIFTRLYPMRERFSLFPEYWYYLSCAAMETGHFKEGLEACDTFFKVNRGLFRDDPMVGTVAFNKAFMLPKTKENKPEVRRCLELAWTKNANVTHPDWQLDYLAAIMYKGVFDEKEKAGMMLEHAIALIEQESRERTRYGSKAGVTLDEGLRNCRNALHQLRGEPIEEPKLCEEESALKQPEPKEASKAGASLESTQTTIDTRVFDISICDDGVVVTIPNDSNLLLDKGKWLLQAYRGGTVVSTLTPGNLDKGKPTPTLNVDKKKIVFYFHTDSKPTRMTAFKLVYDDPNCSVVWTIPTLLNYISESGFDSMAQKCLDAHYDSRVSPGFVRFATGLADVFGEGDSKIRPIIKDALKDDSSLLALFLKCTINGKDHFYEWSNNGTRARLDDDRMLDMWQDVFLQRELKQMRK